MDHCGRGICAAMAGHEGTCAEASGWADKPDDDTAHPTLSACSP